jgi:hypothetical protein
LACPGCDRLPTGPARASTFPVRGITFVDWTPGGYAGATADAALEALAATGANTVTLIVTAYQAGPAESGLRSEDPRTPGSVAVRRAIETARALGLRVAIKPHVDLDDGSWRGKITPRDPEAWFRSYRSFLVRWAGLAESLGVEQYVLGTELAGTLEQERLWRDTIRQVRSVFSGELLYAASWDEAGRVPFWRDLDLIGIDFYLPVAERNDAGRFEILAGWQPWLDRLELLHRQTGRPILLAEIGYRSVDGAGRHPYAFGALEPLDLGEQADLYWAALEATRTRPWLKGMYWWNWPADGSGGPENRDYTPRGKFAERELRAAWADGGGLQ